MSRKQSNRRKTANKAVRGGTAKPRRLSIRRSHPPRSLPKRPTLREHGYRIKSHVRGNKKNKAVTMKNIHRGVMNLLPNNMNTVKNEETDEKMNVERLALRRESRPRLAKTIVEIEREERQQEEASARHRRDLLAQQRQSHAEMENLFSKFTL